MSNPKIEFYSFDEVDDGLLKFAVIVARHEGKWIYCKAKNRQTYEIAGGHRESGEAILDTAKRELNEETGAIEFDITPICVYSVVRDDEESMGGLFFANVTKLQPINSEIESITLFETPPKNLTYPQIQPHLHRKVQAYLNTNSSSNEVWDIYDENRVLTGRTHLRKNPLKKGDYHLAVHVWIQHSNGEFLITKRAPNKGDGNMWECTAGSAISGDDSQAAALREVKEETGLDINPKNGKVVLSYKRENCFVDVWLFKQDFLINEVTLQEGETIDAKSASASEILSMYEKGIFVPCSYIANFFEHIK